MESHEACRKAFKPVGCKNVARGMKLSHSIVNKWSEPRPPNGSGLLNPPDRMARLMALTGNDVLIRWLCVQAGGFFVANPPVAASPASKAAPATLDLTQAEHALQRNIGELEIALTEAWEKPDSPSRVEKLGATWEALKSNGERLVRALKDGEFRLQLTAWLLKVYPVYDALTPGGLI